MAIDPRCTYSASVSKSSLAEAKRLLEAVQKLEMGCRVIKHPDCCVLCAANNDCGRLPVHYNCRCKPDNYLKVLGDE